MKAARFLPLVMICLVFAMIAGCSDETTLEPEAEDDLRDRPAIPEPTYYSGPVPEKSLELIVRTVELSNYVACFDSMRLGPTMCGGDFPCHMFPACPDLGPTRIRLVESDTIVTCTDSLSTQAAAYTHTGNPDWCGFVWANPLSSAPYLQHVRYWVRLGIVERYSGSTSVTVTRSTTRGIERTQAEEFGMSIGMEVSASGGLFVTFSATLRTEFSYSSSTSLTVSEEETVEESFTITCPDNQNIVYCVWQLVDEFRIVGVDGQEFTDPYYRFTEGSNQAVCPTPEFVPVTTYFDNP